MADSMVASLQMGRRLLDLAHRPLADQ